MGTVHLFAGEAVLLTLPVPRLDPKYWFQNIGAKIQLEEEQKPGNNSSFPRLITNKEMSLALLAGSVALAAAKSPPNFAIVFGDDWGWVSCEGGCNRG